MDKKGFSLIEIIFVLLVMSIIITLAVSKFGTAFDRTNISKIKSDIVKIREGINLYKNKMILKNESYSFTNLDENNNNNELFNKILENPILAEEKSQATSWYKISNNKYKVFLDSSNSIEFIFDNINYTFDCNIQNTLCKELNL